MGMFRKKMYSGIGNKRTVSPQHTEITEFNKAMESLKEAHVNSTKFGLNMNEQTG